MLLFELELQAQKLRDDLNRPLSPKLKLLRLSSFLHSLIDKPEHKRYISYFVEFEHSLISLIEKNDCSVIPPEEIKTVTGIIEILKDIQEFSEKSNEFDNSINKLRAAQEKCLFLLGENSSYIPDSTKKKPVSHRDSIHLVLLESNDCSEISDCFGEILTLKLDLTEKGKNSESDTIEFQNHTDVDDNLIQKHLEKAAVIAKERLQRDNVQLKNYNFRFHFENNECIYTGTSLGIGAVCLAYNALLIQTLQKYYFRFKSNAVYTGCISDDGSIGRVSSASLRNKLRTVFFSTYKIFVIPEDNLSEAKEELLHLQNKYPNRNLELIPVRNYERVFDDLYIIEKIKLSPAKRVTEIYRRNALKYNLAASLLILAGLIWMIYSLILPRIDKNPESFGCVNNQYTLYNKYGIEIWHSEELEPYNTEVFSGEAEKQTRCILTDLNGDSTKELLYLNRAVTNMDKSMSIFCSNQDIKGFPFKIPQHRLDYPNDPVENFSMCLKGIILSENKTDGKKNIIYYGQHFSFFPGVLGKISGEGNSISEFWNEGMPSCVKTFDIDDDGKEKIFWGGCNNRDSIECAAMLVFDPMFIEGASPYSDPIHSGKPGMEQYYIIFPKSIINVKAGKERNDVIQIQKAADKTILVWVGEDVNANGGSISYIFDSKMNLLKADPDDGFKNKYNNLRETSGIKLPPLKDYIENIKTKIRWWDGEKFVYHTAVNKNYVEAKKE